MKSIFISLAILFSAQIATAQELGKKVEIYSDNIGPQFSVIFSYDDHTIWTVTLSLLGGNLLPDFSMKTLAWSLYDSNSGAYINDWTIAVNNSTAVLYPGAMSFSWNLEEENQIMMAIEKLQYLKIVLSVNHSLSNPTPTHYVDLASYCGTNSGHFLNLTTGEPGCIIVDQTVK